MLSINLFKREQQGSSSFLATSTAAFGSVIGAIRLASKVIVATLIANQMVFASSDNPQAVVTTADRAAHVLPLAAQPSQDNALSTLETREESLGLFASPFDPQHEVLPDSVPASDSNTNPIDHLEVGNDEFVLETNLPVSSDVYQQARAILFDKWRARKDAPPTFAQDLDELARYIASQPKAFELLAGLKDKRLKLAYAPLEFHSVVKGTAFHVRSVTIFFDPRAAAILNQNMACKSSPGLCTASAADAFIHELIHASIALLETESFVRSGAMNSVVYPFAHEREVLKRERELYSAMTLHDKQHRPLRYRHAGHLRAAACVTCL